MKPRENHTREHAARMNSRLHKLHQGLAGDVLATVCLNCLSSPNIGQIHHLRWKGGDHEAVSGTNPKQPGVQLWGNFGSRQTPVKRYDEILECQRSIKISLRPVAKMNGDSANCPARREEKPLLAHWQVPKPRTISPRLRQPMV